MLDDTSRPKTAVALRDVAEASGYAVSTVSQVLNGNERCYASEKAREAIRAAAGRLGYRPNYFARGLRNRRSRLIGIVARLFASETQLFQLGALARRLRQNGFMTSFANLSDIPDDVEDVLQDVVDRCVEGIIVVQDTHEPPPTLESIPRHIPAIVVAASAVKGFPCLVIDREESVRRATEAMIKRGHRRLAFVGGNLLHNAGKVRGFERAMGRHGLATEGMIRSSSHIPGEVRQIVVRDRRFFEGVTAVMTTGDRIAAELMLGLRDIGRGVPEDCSVVGYGDQHLADLITPALSTVRLPREEVAAVSAQMLLDLMEGKKVENVTMVPKFIERESSRARERTG